MPTHHISVAGVRLVIAKRYRNYYAILIDHQTKLIMDKSLSGVILKAIWFAKSIGCISEHDFRAWYSQAYEEKGMEKSKLQVGMTWFTFKKADHDENCITASFISPNHHEKVVILDAGKTIGEATVVALNFAKKAGLVTQEQIDQALL